MAVVGSLAKSGHYLLFRSSMLFPYPWWRVILLIVVSSDVASLLTSFGNLVLQRGQKLFVA